MPSGIGERSSVSSVGAHDPEVPIPVALPDKCDLLTIRAPGREKIIAWIGCELNHRVWVEEARAKGIKSTTLPQ